MRVASLGGTGWIQSSIRSDGVRRRGGLIIFGAFAGRYRTSASLRDLDPVITTIQEENLNWLGTLRGRFGVLPAPSLLAYVTGGLAVGQGAASTTTMVPRIPLSGGCGPQFGGNFFCSAGSSAKTLVGWTVGGGLEASVGGPWTAKAECLYCDLGTLSHTAVETGIPVLFATPILQASAQFRGHIARVGLNYRLGQ